MQRSSAIDICVGAGPELSVHIRSNTQDGVRGVTQGTCDKRYLVSVGLEATKGQSPTCQANLLALLGESKMSHSLEKQPNFLLGIKIKVAFSTIF